MSEEKLLRDGPGLQPLRKELLTLALDYYEKFINERADDPSVRKELADVYIRAANIYQLTYTGPDKMGRKRGDELRVRGIALYEDLVREKQAIGNCGSHWRKTRTLRGGNTGRTESTKRGWRATAGRSNSGSSYGPLSPTTLSSGAAWAVAIPAHAFEERHGRR